MGIFLAAILIAIISFLYDRDTIGGLIARFFSFLFIAFILTIGLNIGFDGTASQEAHILKETREELRAFEYNCFLINTEKRISYLVSTETGTEIKTINKDSAIINYTEGIPSVYSVTYSYKNKILNFILLNINTKKIFYIPENTSITNYYVNLKGG